MPNAPRPFLRRGQGSEKYKKIDYPELRKAGLHHGIGQRIGRDGKEEIHYASSPVVSQSTSMQTSQRVPRLDIQQDDFSTTVPSFTNPLVERNSRSPTRRTDSGRGGDSDEGRTSSRRSTDERMNEPTTKNGHRNEEFGETPIYGAMSSRTVDSGFDNAQQAGSGSEVNELSPPRPQEETVNVTRDRYDVLTNESPVVDTNSVCEREVSSRASDEKSSSSALSRSLMSFEQHEEWAVRDNCMSDSLSASTTQYTLGTRQGSQAAKRNIKLSDNLRGLPQSTKSTSASARSTPSSHETPNSENTSAAISSIRPSTSGSSNFEIPTLPPGDSQQEASDDSDPSFARRHLGPRQPLDNIVPSISQLNKEPIHRNVLPSQATQIQPRRVIKDDETPLNRPKPARRGRSSSLSRIVSEPEYSELPQRPQQVRPRSPAQTVQRDHRNLQRHVATASVHRSAEENLTKQLRDTIINLDFCEGAYRKKWEELVIKLKDETLIAKREHEEWQSQKKIQEERLKREWDTVRREKKSMRLTETEREKEMQKQCDEQKTLVDRIRTQLADCRAKNKKLEDTITELRKEVEDGKAVHARQEKRRLQLEKQVNSQRKNSAKEAERLAAEARVNANRRPGLMRASAALNRSLPSTSSQGAGSQPDAYLQSRIAFGNGKSVKWADQPNQPTMRFEGTYGVGSPPEPVDFYCSDADPNITTKVSRKECGCYRYDYSDQIRFISADRSVQVYFHMNEETHIVYAPNMVIFLYKSGQFEIHRKNGEISCVQPSGRLVEVFRQRSDGIMATETIDPQTLEARGVELSRLDELTRICPDDIQWLMSDDIKIWFSRGEAKISFKTLSVSVSAPGKYAAMKHKNVDPYNQNNTIKTPCHYWEKLPTTVAISQNISRMSARGTKNLMNGYL